MAKRTGGFIGQDGINAPDQATGVSGTAGDEQVTVSWTAPSDVGGAAITGYNVQSADGSGSYESSYDLGNASYDNISFDPSEPVTSPEGIRFNNDGTKLFAINKTNETIYQYSLSPAFDISSSSYDSVSLTVTSQEENPTGLNFNNDGTKMYVVGSTGDAVFQYALTTGFDLSTASYDSVSFSVSSQETGPRDVCFNSDGTKMYILGVSADAVFQYSLSTAFNVGTASYDSVSFSISQDTVPEGLTFNADGTKLFVVGSTGDSVYQYSLSTAFNVSTMSYDNVSFSVSGQDATPRAVEFNSSGAKMYVCGATSDTIYQYSTGIDTYPTASPVTVTGLTNGTEYTFNVWAINPFGWSSPSDASGGVSPAAPIGLFAGGLTAGGSSSASNVIDFITLSSAGNATDFGDLTVSRYELGGGSGGSSTRGLFFGGENTSGTKVNVVDYITFASAGNATDFGNSTNARNRSGVCSSSTRALSAGGNNSNVIDYYTIASAGNGTDFGDLISNSDGLAGLASPTRGVFKEDGDANDTISYVTISSTGNAADFGDILSVASKLGSGSNTTRGIFTGGGSNVIQYITIASTGNATDFGNLTTSSEQNIGVTSATIMAISLASDGSSKLNTIDQVTIATTGNATDFGDLSVTRNNVGGASSAHGGLS
jgi:6-phosphogluconolactonase (cycloisomerase 2 family)